LLDRNSPSIPASSLFCRGHAKGTSNPQVGGIGKVQQLLLRRPDCALHLPACLPLVLPVSPVPCAGCQHTSPLLSFLFCHSIPVISALGPFFFLSFRPSRRLPGPSTSSATPPPVTTPRLCDAANPRIRRQLHHSPTYKGRYLDNREKFESFLLQAAWPPVLLRPRSTTPRPRSASTRPDTVWLSLQRAARPPVRASATSRAAVRQNQRQKSRPATSHG